MRKGRNVEMKVGLQWLGCGSSFGPTIPHVEPFSQRMTCRRQSQIAGTIKCEGTSGYNEEKLTMPRCLSYNILAMNGELPEERVQALSNYLQGDLFLASNNLSFFL